MKKQYVSPAIRVQAGELESTILAGGSTLTVDPSQETPQNLSKGYVVDWEEDE